MPKNNKKGGSRPPTAQKLPQKLAQEVKKIVRHEHLAPIPAFIKQHGLQQKVCTYSDMRISIPTTIPPATVPETTKASFMNANGFQQFSSTGQLTLPEIPQSALFDLEAAMYRYYAVEWIELHWVPSRLQFDVSAQSQNSDMYQAPTIIGTLPTSDQLVNFTPVSNPGLIIDRCRQLTARKTYKVAKGEECTRMRINLLDNLLSRQDAPMLRTNGSSAQREQYNTADLLSIANLINVAPVSRLTLGYYVFTMQVRFAGLINPNVPAMMRLQPQPSEKIEDGRQPQNHNGQTVQYVQKHYC